MITLFQNLISSWLGLISVIIMGALTIETIILCGIAEWYLRQMKGAHRYLVRTSRHRDSPSSIRVSLVETRTFFSTSRMSMTSNGKTTRS